MKALELPELIKKAAPAVASRPSLRWQSSTLADRVADRVKVPATELPGAFLDGIVHVKFAIRRLDPYQPGGDCSCARFADYSFTSPGAQARRGRVTMLKETVYREEYFTRWRCVCTECGLHWGVRDEQGWHVATHRWTPLPDLTPKV